MTRIVNRACQLTLVRLIEWIEKWNLRARGRQGAARLLRFAAALRVTTANAPVDRSYGREGAFRPPLRPGLIDWKRIRQEQGGVLALAVLVPLDTGSVFRFVAQR